MNFAVGGGVVVDATPLGVAENLRRMDTSWGLCMLGHAASRRWLRAVGVRLAWLARALRRSRQRADGA